MLAVEFDWIGFDWIRLDLIGFDWIGFDWIGFDCGVFQASRVVLCYFSMSVRLRRSETLVCNPYGMAKEWESILGVLFQQSGQRLFSLEFESARPGPHEDEDEDEDDFHGAMLRTSTPRSRFHRRFCRCLRRSRHFRSSRLRWLSVVSRYESR